MAQDTSQQDHRLLQQYAQQFTPVRAEAAMAKLREGFGLVARVPGLSVVRPQGVGFEPGISPAQAALAPNTPFVENNFNFGGGQAGPPGADGAAGADGVDGADGADGAAGAPGQPQNIKTGEPDESATAVTDTGTQNTDGDHAIVMDFRDLGAGVVEYRVRDRHFKARVEEANDGDPWFMNVQITDADSSADPDRWETLLEYEQCSTESETLRSRQEFLDYILVDENGDVVVDELGNVVTMPPAGFELTAAEQVAINSILTLAGDVLVGTGGNVMTTGQASVAMELALNTVLTDGNFDVLTIQGNDGAWDVMTKEVA